MSDTESRQSRLVPIQEGTRGATLATSALSGQTETVAPSSTTADLAQTLVQRATGKLTTSQPDFGYLFNPLGLDNDTWQGIIEAKITKLATQNPDTLTMNSARINWAAKVEAYLALTRQYGFQEVDQMTDVEQASQSLVIALTTSGSVIMLGPGTSYGGVKADGDGRFAITYIKGREGKDKPGNGEVPSEVSVQAGAKGAKVTVYTQDTRWDDVKSKYITVWNEAGNAPIAFSQLDIDHSLIDKANYDVLGTSQLLKVMMLPHPENVEVLMGAFEGVSDEINRLTGTRAIRRPVVSVGEE